MAMYNLENVKASMLTKDHKLGYFGTKEILCNQEERLDMGGVRKIEGVP